MQCDCSHSHLSVCRFLCRTRISRSPRLCTRPRPTVCLCPCRCHLLGEANVLDWVPSDNDPNAGTGQYGTCCTEMDIWEANKVSSAYTPHTCSVVGQTRCGEGTGVDCGDIDDSNPDSR